MMIIRFMSAADGMEIFTAYTIMEMVGYMDAHNGGMDFVICETVQCNGIMEIYVDAKKL